VLVPGGAPQLRAGNRVEQAGGEDGEVGEHIRYRVLGMGEPNHYRGIVRVIHERHVREIVQARIRGRCVSRRRQGPRDVAGRRGHAVAPAHAGLQSEGETLPVFRPRPRAREVRPGHERRVVAHERGEQDVALYLLGERVHGEQGINALEVRPGCVHLGATAQPAQLAAQRRALGLDRPRAAQYAIWLARFVRGDWGRSIATGRSVRELLGDAVLATVALVGTSLLLSYLLGLAVGSWQS